MSGRRRNVRRAALAGIRTRNVFRGQSPHEQPRQLRCHRLWHDGAWTAYPAHIGQELGLSGWLAKRRAGCEEATARGDAKLIFTAEPDKGHAMAILRFVDEICGEGPTVCGIEESVMASRVAFAAIKSAQEHRNVRLEEI